MWDIFRIFTPVKEKVTDISKVLQDMTAEMRLMRETINQQYAEIAKLNRNIEALNRQLRKKDEENSILKERLSKYEKPKKNSGNSSTPPSLDNLLKLNICNFGKKFETLKKGLIKCRNYIFNFLEDPMIPSDNNGSERGIRKLKIKLKNSCTFRSDFGADAFLELHSIVETAKKRNKTPFNAIQALFEA